MKSNEERVNSIMNKAQIYKRKRGQVISTVTLAVCMMVAVISGIKLNGIKKGQNEPVNNGIVSGEENSNVIEEKFITFASKEELISRFKENSKKYTNTRSIFSYGMTDDAVAESAEMPAAVNDSAQKSSETASVSESDYSTTNVQTQGVDESDIIKTDGKRIFYMGSDRRNVRIFEDSESGIKLVRTINFADEKNYSYGESMFLDDKYLIVIATGSTQIDKEDDSLTKKVMDRIYPYQKMKQVLEVLIYDVNTLDLVRKIETEGNIISSRKVGDNLYIVSNKYLYYYAFDEGDVIPVYRDSMDNDSFCEVPIESIRGFKDFDENEQCNYMIISSLNLSNINNKINIETYLGAGEQLYCSTKNLYVTRSNYDYITYPVYFDDVAVESSMVASTDEATTSTNIHKFALSDGKVEYVATGKVNGTLLNQFSMDEYDGNFRITTTDNNGNNLYVLDKNLKQIGSLENLAKGERIYSTRFMGDKAYVVTYKTVDPLFVIDLKNPSNPTVLGELKIPGYSSYLHPLGDHYLLGFGEDSVEKSYINWEGKQEVVAYATGLKMAIFDVSDYSNPKELYSVKIGGRGSSSELLYNHKALLLDEAKKIFAFPVTVTKEAGYYEDGTPMYGEVDFAGALVYNIDVESGFELKGKITHDSDVKNYYKYGNIERIIYIGNKFYTVSNNMIKATDMNTMKEVSSCKF